MKATLDTIARKTLGLETLETRKSDSLDFHDLAVWAVRSALEQAFQAGKGTKPEADADTRAFAKDSADENVLQTASTQLLLMVADGQIDLNLLARLELANRGLDADGKWVGFKKAAEIHGA